jgi:hypothetical protein
VALISVVEPPPTGGSLPGIRPGVHLPVCAGPFEPTLDFRAPTCTGLCNAHSCTLALLELHHGSSNHSW